MPALITEYERPWTAEEIKARNELSWKLLQEYVARAAQDGVTSININRLDPDDHAHLHDDDLDKNRQWFDSAESA